MYITEVLTKTKSGKLSHRCILLRQSYRQNGKAKNRTIANLTHCKPEEIAAIRLALKHKNDLGSVKLLPQNIQLREGLSVGAVWTVYQTAVGLGIEKALGKHRQGKLAMWQVMARVIEQGSRLSAVRLAQKHAACDVLGMRQGFDENDLYENLAWLAEHQRGIERGLFEQNYSDQKPQLYLYDVSSSYLEGQHNEMSAFGYNRDGKRGKKQIVIGLLCDHRGKALSIEVFEGNTQDPQTLASQIRKVAEGFGAKEVTFVGDRGMIKTQQIDQLAEKGFHYITAITKPQIERLLADGVLQMELFDQPLAEVISQGEKLRYILRRNPQRAEEIKSMRESKLAYLKQKIEQSNDYLKNHGRAKVEIAFAKMQTKVVELKIQDWVRIQISERSLVLSIDSAALEQEQQLDGCYVLKTDVAAEVADKQLIQDRYKDLALVERAFRTSKTAELEMRPVYVQRESSTRGHALVVMLAYQIVQHLQEAWIGLDRTVEEGLRELSTLCSIEVVVNAQSSCHRIPTPRPISAQLLKSLGLEMPEALPQFNARVVTRKKLSTQRKRQY